MSVWAIKGPAAEHAANSAQRMQALAAIQVDPNDPVNRAAEEAKKADSPPYKVDLSEQGRTKSFENKPQTSVLDIMNKSGAALAKASNDNTEPKSTEPQKVYMWASGTRFSTKV